MLIVKLLGAKGIGNNDGIPSHEIVFYIASSENLFDMMSLLMGVVVISTFSHSSAHSPYRFSNEGLENFSRQWASSSSVFAVK